MSLNLEGSNSGVCSICNAFDFLPLNCKSCDGQFCSRHFMNHACVSLPNKKIYAKESVYQENANHAISSCGSSDPVNSILTVFHESPGSLDNELDERIKNSVMEDRLHDFKTHSNNYGLCLSENKILASEAEGKNDPEETIIRSLQNHYISTKPMRIVPENILSQNKGFSSYGNLRHIVLLSPKVMMSIREAQHKLCILKNEKYSPMNKKDHLLPSYFHIDVYPLISIGQYLERLVLSMLNFLFSNSSTKLSVNFSLSYSFEEIHSSYIDCSGHELVSMLRFIQKNLKVFLKVFLDSNDVLSVANLCNSSTERQMKTKNILPHGSIIALDFLDELSMIIDDNSGKYSSSLITPQWIVDMLSSNNSLYVYWLHLRSTSKETAKESPKILPGSSSCALDKENTITPASTTEGTTNIKITPSTDLIHDDEPRPFHDSRRLCDMPVHSEILSNQKGSIASSGAKNTFTTYVRIKVFIGDHLFPRPILPFITSISPSSSSGAIRDSLLDKVGVPRLSQNKMRVFKLDFDKKIMSLDLSSPHDLKSGDIIFIAEKIPNCLVDEVCEIIKNPKEKLKLLKGF